MSRFHQAIMFNVLYFIASKVTTGWASISFTIIAVMWGLLAVMALLNKETN